MLGKELTSNFRIVQNNAFNVNQLEFIGTSSSGMKY
jgi:hypothetical protein